MDKLESEETQLSFEQAMEQLEQIVQRLEQGDASLEQSIELFQQGMLLAKRCGDQLEHAEKKIEMLMLREDGQLERQPYPSMRENGDF